MAKYLRRLVSTNKRRYQHDGYDLDLSYITPRIIAMGFPCDGASSLYRNPASQVRQLLDERHAGRYKVYNLCVERGYNADLFHGRVMRLPMYDGQAPPLHLLLAFCLDAAAWLAADPAHVIAVHCKAGKGRTGTAVCAMLLTLEPHLDDISVNAVLSCWAKQRTKDGKGLTIPSQRRFLSCFHKLLLAAATKLNGPGGPNALLNGVSKTKAVHEVATINGSGNSLLPVATSMPLVPMPPITIPNSTMATTECDPNSQAHQPTSLLKHVALQYASVRINRLHVQGLPLAALRDCTVCVWWRPVHHYEAYIVCCVRTRTPQDDLFAGCKSAASADAPSATSSSISGTCPAGATWTVSGADGPSLDERGPQLTEGKLLLDFTTMRSQPAAPPSPRPLSYYTPLAEPVSALPPTAATTAFCDISSVYDGRGNLKPKPAQRGRDVIPSSSSSPPLSVGQVPTCTLASVSSARPFEGPNPSSYIPNAVCEASTSSTVAFASPAANRSADDAIDGAAAATSSGGPILAGDIKVNVFRGSVARPRHDIFQGRSLLFSAWLGCAFLDPQVSKSELNGNVGLDKVVKPLRRLGSRLALVLEYERVS